MLCDLCIIQLNVAYQFKTLAVEMDAKHQQYIIETGIIHIPNNDNRALQYIEHSRIERSSTTMLPLSFPGGLATLELGQHRRLIKSEPTDYEIMSDITIDTNTNTDHIEEFQTSAANSESDHQFDASNMVCVNDVDLLRMNGNSDIDFINNCLPSSMAFRGNFEKPVTTTTTTTTSQLVIAASKPIKSSQRHESQEPDRAKKLNETAFQHSPPKPVRKRRTKRNFNEIIKLNHKTLRPKSNEKINYSLVKANKRGRKLLNPLNKMKQKIKEETESTKPTSKHPSTLQGNQKKEFTQRKNVIQFRPGQAQAAGNRRITIKDNDRFKFAAIKINSVTTTRN